MHLSILLHIFVTTNKNNIMNELALKLRKSIDGLTKVTQELVAITIEAIEANPKKIANIKKAQITIGNDLTLVDGITKDETGSYVIGYYGQDDDAKLLLEELEANDLINIAAALIDIPEDEF